MRTRVKLCGITRIEDARAGVEAGVDGLGFIFAPRSPRYVTSSQAAQIIDCLPPFVDRIGVFVNEELARVEHCIRQCGLNGVQLHGDEPASYCEQLRTRHPYLMIYKAMRVGEEGVKGEISAYDEVVSALLFDTFTAAKEGGTGIAFDWGLIDSLPVSLPLILAGGLGPDNIAAAIDAVRPYAVDINSGVESEPGCKDHTLLYRLMRIVSEKNRDIETR
jgi:phosphoribosylanthranilate isomerase